jgi:hypothetical protein
VRERVWNWRKNERWISVATVLFSKIDLALLPPFCLMLPAFLARDDAAMARGVRISKVLTQSAKSRDFSTQHARTRSVARKIEACD